MLSNKFFEKIKLTGHPIHEIAWEAGLTPNQLYKITSGIDRPKRNDLRVIKLCEYLGMHIDDAFETEDPGKV